LVAVIAHDRNAHVDDDLRALAECYETLHARAGRQTAPSPSWVGATAFGRSRRWGQVGQWAMVAGCVHPQSGVLTESLEALDGQFALVRQAGETIEVATDPFGMQALHVAHRTGRSYVSTSALTLAAHLGAPPEPDGVMAFLRTGYQFGARTLWRGVERLEPATALRFAGDGPSRRCYWRVEPDPSMRELTLDETVERCLDALVDTLSARLAEGPCLWADLTGGFDSRLMCLALRAAQVEFTATTAGPSGSADVEIARRLAAMADWPWSHLDLGDAVGPVAEVTGEALAWGDGNLEALQLAEVLWIHRRNAATCGRLINGGGGEHLRHYASAQELLRAGRSTRVNLDRWVDLRMLAPEDTSVFRENPTPRVRRDLLERMRERAVPRADLPNTVQLDLLYAYKSTGHFGAYTSAARGHLDAELPFYWKPVFTAAISARDRFRTQHRLQRQMIAALDARLAAVVTQRGGPAEPWRAGNLHRFAPYYVRQARNLGRRLAAGRLPAATGRPASVNQTRARALAELGPRLDATVMRSGSLYRPEGLADLVARAHRPGFTQWPLVGRIVTLEMALEAADARL
jgi:hypothetical protein